MLKFVQHFCVFLARILLSLFFLWHGALIVTNWRAACDALTDKGLGFAVPLLVAQVGCLLLGGLLLILGFRGRLGALLLIIFLVAETALHSQWIPDFDMSKVATYSSEITDLAQNLGLLGGLLMVFGFGSGGLSVDMIMGQKTKTSE